MNPKFKRPTSSRPPTQQPPPKRQKLDGQPAADSDQGNNPEPPADPLAATRPQVNARNQPPPGGRPAGGTPVAGATAPVSLNLDDHKQSLAVGTYASAEGPFQTLFENGAPSAHHVAVWVGTIFIQPWATKNAVGNERLLRLLVLACQRTLRQGGAVHPKEAARMLDSFLKNLPLPARPLFAANLVNDCWYKPDIIDDRLCTFLLNDGGLVTDPNLADLHPRLFNMLWNAGMYDAVCFMVDQGCGTVATSYVDRAMHDIPDVFKNFTTGQTIIPVGFHTGFIQPLEHLLSRYVWLVGMLYPNGTDQLKPAALNDPDVAKAVERFGDQTAWKLELANETNLDRGIRVVDGARKCLAALARRGRPPMIMTSWSDIVASPLVQHFKDENAKGSIWGFEHLRLSFVQAAHLLPGGKKPLRMIEIWEVVKRILDEETYRLLLANPDTVINDILKQVESMFNAPPDDPISIPGLPEIADQKAYWAAFEQQCRGYLSTLARRAPAMKFSTLLSRGTTADAYYGAMGCKAGLWWSKEHRLPVLYCLDGIADQMIIDYKSTKTTAINLALQNPGAAKYSDIVTLAEIREILTNWGDLSDTVTFYRFGKEVPSDAVNDLIVLMKAADAGQRSTPARISVNYAISSTMSNLHLGDLSAAPFKDMDDPTYYHVVTQYLLLLTALEAQEPQVLAAYLTSKGTKHLVASGLLMTAFCAGFADLRSTPDPEARAEKAVALKKLLAATRMPETTKKLLEAAIDR